jgi:hypothetical protein
MEGPAPARVTAGARKVRSRWRLASIGLSARYARFGAVNAKGFAVGNSWVAARQPDPAGGTISTIAGRSSSPLAQMSAAGMLMCAWVESTAR